VGRYIARRLLVAIPTLLALSILIFVLVQAAPGNPAQELAYRLNGGQQPTPAQFEAAKKELHLDRPYLTQYAYWLKGIVTGDLGLSFSSKRPVIDVIKDRAGGTLELASAAFVLIILVSIPLGTIAALYHRRWPDQILRVFALIGASMPTFFLAYLLIIWLVTKARLLPVGGRGGFEHLIMPAVVLAMLPTAIISRLLRSSLLEVLDEDFMRTARAKGVGAVPLVIRHGLRNAAIPVTTYLGAIAGSLLEGAVTTEFIFAWPGLGLLSFESISQRDYPMIQATVFLAGAVYIIINLVVDVSYALLDPRIRLESKLDSV